MVEQGISRTAGKWRRAISSIEDMLVAQESAGVEVIEIISSAVNVLSTAQNDDIINLYSVGHEEVTRTMCNMGVEAPFQHTLQLPGPQGEVVRVLVLFDGCAMVSVMCATIFEKVKHRLGGWKSSTRQLRMGTVQFYHHWQHGGSKYNWAR